MSMRCPACGKAAEGNFCSSCGTSLSSPRQCASCGNEPPAGAKFCNMCGTPLTTAARATGRASAGSPGGSGSSKAPWLVGAAAVLIIAAVLLAPRLRSSDSFAVQSPVPSVPTGNPAAVDLSTMTPREAADRLYERVMVTVSSGDSASALAFLPMALAAYDRVPELDLDARYHLATLHVLAGDAASARAEADLILAEDSTHLLGLYAAAQAASSAGDVSGAVALYRRFLAALESQETPSRPEYLDHAHAFPIMRDSAIAFVGREGE